MKASVAICMQTGGQPRMEFLYSLGNMLILTMQAHPFESLKAGMITNYGTYVDRGREDLAIAALSQEEVTHILWLDDDMEFPPDLLIRLLERDVPFVGVNYPTRVMPIKPTAIRHTGLDGEAREHCYTGPKDVGAEQVAGLGFGAVLIRREVFDAMPRRPWFEEYFDQERKYWIGEDVQFCMEATRVGFPPLVDHDLSKEILHVGTFKFGCDHMHALHEVTHGLAE